MLSSFSCVADGDRDPVEFGDRFRWKFQCRGREIFAEMADRRCAGNEKNVGGALKQPRQSDLRRRRPHGCCSRVERCRLERREASEREIRHVGNALDGQIIDESFVAALGHVVEILNADNLRDGLRLSELQR